MQTQNTGFTEAAASAAFAKVKSKQVKDFCREISNQTQTTRFNLNQVSSKSIPPMDSLTNPVEMSRFQDKTSNRKNTVSKARKHKKPFRADDVLKEIDKPDRKRMTRVLKSFLLKAEELDPEAAALSKSPTNKTERRLMMFQKQ